MTEPTSRLIDQRLRNRIIDALECFADGDEIVREVGAAEYFECYFDFVPHRDDGGQHSNSALNDLERLAISRVSEVVDAACDNTLPMVEDKELIDSDWPKRIAVVAQEALNVMLPRGRFSEEREELTPSGR